MQLYDLIDPDQLREQIELGHVAERHHSTLPLAILNYTARCQYANDWNEVTSKTRGLIYNTDTGEIVARPFEKFFNLNQHTDEEIPTGRMRVLEKMDGSLGILYPVGMGEYNIATRGSFTSDQAIWATNWLHEYADMNFFDPTKTYLFEILVRWNRIVVDYKWEGLVLLAIIDNETGNDESLPQHSGVEAFKIVVRHDISSIEDLLSCPPINNAEGYVVVFDNNFRVKVKHEEYVRLHRILTNVTARSVFECVTIEDLKRKGFDDKTISRSVSVAEEEVAIFPSLGKFLDGVPDEFYTWVHKVVHRLEGEFTRISSEVESEFSRIMEQLKSDNRDRAKFATLASKSKYASIMFTMFDGRPYDAVIWKSLRPEHEKPFGERSEDTS